LATPKDRAATSQVSPFRPGTGTCCDSGAVHNPIYGPGGATETLRSPGPPIARRPPGGLRLEGRALGPRSLEDGELGDREHMRTDRSRYLDFCQAGMTKVGK
jgi:hypothetical protein